VTGGKGGVGKTTVAANLGVLLGRSGADPLLVDLDFGLANLDVTLGVRPVHTVEDFLAGRRDLEACLHPTPGGARMLPAGSGSYEMGRPDPRRRVRLREAFSRVDAGIVVGDSPAGIGDDVLDFAVMAERVLVVTTPEPAAVTDAYGVIKAVDAYAADHGVEVPTPELFVNLATDAREARTVAEKLAAICERFLARSPRFVGWMPRSRTVLRGIVEQRPFVLEDDGSPAGRCLERLSGHFSSLVSQASGEAPGR
jgi:flagellar biosynthesis protein FlhG